MVSFKVKVKLYTLLKEEDANEARERSQRADRMRQQRAMEAKQLIQSSSAEARKIFTRNSSQVRNCKKTPRYVLGNNLFT